MSANNISYRPDIDGLRAVAVMSVLLFHVDPGWMPGGYVGVDVFFVISGYLITSVISEQIKTGGFTYADFYRRRIKRLFPVLFTVIISTIIAGSFILGESAFMRLAMSAIAGTFFFANIYFAYGLDSDYFAPDTAFEPLLHLWSLGVEEQFYLFWPVILGIFGAAWLFRWGGIGVIAVVSALSFLLAEWVVRDHPMFAYYMLPTRLGELLLGVLAFGLVSRGFAARLPALGREFIALLGLGSIAWSLVALNNETVFPGLAAVPATAGTAAIIFAGAAGKNVVGRILSFGPIVWIGLLSYSLYLWHWPVLAYLKYMLGDLDFTIQILAVAGIFVLSATSYYFIETPIRLSRASVRALAIKAFAIPALVISGLSAAAFATQGYGWRVLDQDYRQSAEAYSTAASHVNSLPFVCFAVDWSDRDVGDVSCRVNTLNQPSVLLWGDSNSAHYVPALRVYAEEFGFGFTNIAHGLCPPLSLDAGRFTTAERRAACSRSAQIVFEAAADYDTVILSGSWNTYLRADAEGLLEALRETIDALRARGSQVIVLGRIPSQPGFDRECDSKRLRLPFLQCGSGSGVDDQATINLNSQIEEVAIRAGAQYYDFNAALCSDGVCRTSVNSRPAYFDAGHLSAEGSQLVGRYRVGDEDTIRIFGSLEGAGRDTPQIDWDGLSVVDLRSAYVASNGSSSVVDASPEQLVYARFRHGEGNRLLELGPGEAVALRAVLAGSGENTEALIRILLQQSGVETRWDVLVDFSTGRVRTRGGVIEITHMQRDESGAVSFTVRTPWAESGGRFEVRTYPASTNFVGGGYTPEAEGQMELLSLEVATLSPDVVEAD
jgi:peptidoglycan/LPS O-acetylase OafA/YrhL/putative intracellular protease/amidase